MKYTNPKLPEIIERKPSVFGQLGEGLKLAVYLLVGFAVMGLVFFYAGALIGGHVPYSWEKKLATAEIFPLINPHPPEALAKEQALQTLADRIAAIMDVDPEIRIRVHYRDLPTVNAFASFAGHIYVFEGLLGKLEYEEQVAALLAHEIGHVKERHIMKSFSANVLLAIAVAMVSGESGAGDSMGQAVLTLESLSFTRAMEKEADEAALGTLKSLYGSVGGLVALFEAFETGDAPKTGKYEFLLTHPYASSRVDRAEEFSLQEDADLTPPSKIWQVEHPGENP